MSFSPSITDKEKALQRKSMSGSSWQNIAFSYNPEVFTRPLKYRNDPEYSSIKFIIYPDDTLKIVWDLIILR